MAAEADVFAHEAADVQVRTLPGRLLSIDVNDGRGVGHLHMTTRAADSLYLKLGAALHGADEPAREAAYQESQVKAAVEAGLGTHVEDSDPPDAGDGSAWLRDWSRP